MRDGRVQKKNNWSPDRGDYFALAQDEVRLDRWDPGPGFRHVVTVAQLRAFIALLPDWDDLAVGLAAVVLDEGQDSMGWHSEGVIGICAWEQALWWEDGDRDFVEDHRHVLDVLGVERRAHGDALEVCWTEEQARGFQLLHILPHELGHHHDRITTRSQRRVARGEPYAERYAHRVLDAVWPAYARRFGI